MRLNELKKYNNVLNNYTYTDGKLHYNGKPKKDLIVKTKEGLSIEVDLEWLEPVASTVVEVYSHGRLFYTLDYNLEKIANYLKLPADKFNKIFKDGLTYRGYTFKLKGVE